MSGMGIDYEGDPTSPTLTSGAQVLPGTVVVSEVRPNSVTVEGSDGTTATAIATGEAAGLGLLGEYITYSYVLDVPTLQAIADTRLASNIATVAASVEVSAVARYRPWVDYFVGDRLWVDIDAGLPAGWYRIEKIAMRLSSESAGPRFVVDVGRAVVTEDAAVADRLAKLLYAGLIDSATGLNTSGNTGQASTTIIIQSDALPAHTHTISDVSDLDTGGISLGGDLSGTIRQATVERWRGYEIANTGDPNEGDTILWNAANRLAEWAPPLLLDASDLGDLGDVHVPTPANDQVLTWRSGNARWEARTPTGGSASPTQWPSVPKSAVLTSGSGTAHAFKATVLRALVDIEVLGVVYGGVVPVDRQARAVVATATGAGGTLDVVELGSASVAGAFNRVVALPFLTTPLTITEGTYFVVGAVIEGGTGTDVNAVYVVTSLGYGPTDIPANASAQYTTNSPASGNVPAAVGSSSYFCTPVWRLA